MSLPADFYDDTAPRDPVPDPLDQDADDPFYTLHMVHSEMRRRDADPSSELQCPNAPTMRRLVEEYRGWWLDQHGQYGHTDMLKYAYERLVHGPVYRPNVTPEQFLVYETFTELMENEQEFFIFLKSILVHVGMVGEEGDADVHARLQGVLRAHATVRMYYDAVARMFVVARLPVEGGVGRATGGQAPNAMEGAASMPPELRSEASFTRGVETYMDCDAKKNDNFQNAFLALRNKLECRGFRRAEDRLFTRVTTATGLATNAYTFAMSVKQFVSAHTSHTESLDVWRWATRPTGNLRHLEEYISQRVLPEAPFLAENHHLRSYAGDSLGRGAVVYCSRSDFAFEYRHRNEWPRIAAWVTAVRRRLLDDPTYECTAPGANDVCIAHLDCSFPHDVHKELQDLDHLRRMHLVQFRECEEWEMARGMAPVDLPLAAERLDRIVPPRRRTLGSTVGRRWRLLQDTRPPRACARATTLRASELEALTASCDRDLLHDTVELPADPEVPLDPDTCVVLPADGHMWSYVEDGYFTAPANQIDDPAFVAALDAQVAAQCCDVRVRVAPDDLRPVRHRVTPDSFVVLGNGRTYVPCERVLIPLVDHEMQPRGSLAVVGSLWERVRTVPDGLLEVHDAALRRTLDEAVARLPGDRDVVHVDPVDVADDCFVTLSDGTLVRQAGALPRAFDGRRQYLAHGDRRFVVDTGRACFDCNTDEIDHIYNCQRFQDHDKFFLYALKGRLLFRVGERDPHQMTLFLEGYGGCGKSTIMNAQMRFHPPHKRGVLSSNVEPLFGMSQVMKNGEAEVIFCSEVATDLNMKQEEWQVSTGGEIGSFAVKNGKPLVMVCRAQHFWIGNSRPGFKNDQNQMGRRLAAVLMPHPVRPRDGMIAKVVDMKLGHLQRREVVSYAQFVAATGSCDPMSVPETLPPAFRDYHERLRRETDPVQDFIKDGSFVERVDIDQGFVTLDRFKELYEDFRNKHNMGRIVKWGEAVYRPAFNENGVHVKCVPTIVIEGETKHNLMVAYGLQEVARMAL